ncbi:MAG TPA: cob(I)yrinic acid a,c-diamide adenosyltransferase [Patescibacteria group bacterium]
MLLVSTKTGDKGTSGLANGQRVGKEEFIFEVLGSQDEVNSWIGLSLAKLSDHFQPQKKFLLEIQDTLFYIGAEIAQSPKAKLSEAKLQKLEKESEELQAAMGQDWTTKFLYPGGNEAAATLDVTRTVVRRLERLVVRYAQTTDVSPLILKYVNRLSDYIFVLRCYVNHQEKYQEKKFDSHK